MTPVQLPIVPLQSVPPLDTRGGDPTLPPLFARAWWLFFSALAATLNGFNDAIAALVTAIAGKQDAMRSSLQADLVSLSPTLKPGILVNVTDYRHVLQWDGSTYTWGPGEDGRHDIVGLPVDPDDTTGWQLCDGSTVNYLRGDGTTASFTTPNLTSAAAYMKLGSAVSGPNAAVAPTLSIGSITASGTGITASTGGASGTTNVLASSVTSVATGAHTHAVFVSDPTHSHAMGASSVGSNGEPRNYVARPWFRR